MDVFEKVVSPCRGCENEYKTKIVCAETCLELSEFKVILRRIDASSPNRSKESETDYSLNKDRP